MDNLTPGQQAAALHGLATNPTVPVADRLSMALQALDWYENEREQTTPVVEAAEAWRVGLDGVGAARRHLALIAAVDQKEARPVAAAGQCDYLSTACKHAREAGREHLHHDCATGGKRWDGSTKIPATCKWCLAPCRCWCHAKPVVAATS